MRSAVLLLGLLLARGDGAVAQPAQDGARAARTDRLTLDLYLDMETVAEPQLSPDGSQIVYTRGWIDKVERQARVGAVDHERRRQPQPVPRQGIGRAVVALGRPHRVHRTG